jgi:predicted nucleotide-binding protein
MVRFRRGASYRRNSMSLPLKTSADDIRAIAKYLKTKPTGATVAQVKSVNKSISDARKVAAYITWGLVTREGTKLKLTDRGTRLARQPEQEQEVFLEIVGGKTPYRSAIEWAYHAEMDAIDTNDVSAHWHEHHVDAVADANENTLRDNAVCFFYVAEAAGLGELVLGRRGNPTRLDINRQAVQQFVDAGPTTPPWEEAEEVDETTSEGEITEEEVPADPTPEVPDPTEAMRVFISHGSNHAVVEQIEIMLGLADFEAEIAEAEETAAIPVSKKVLGAMRRCQAGIIAVTVDESRKDDEDNYVLNENVLIEIGAAFVLYDERVVLLWDKRLDVPSNLQGLYRCEFEGDELSWTAGMKLMKAIKGFKKADS